MKELRRTEEEEEEEEQGAILFFDFGKGRRGGGGEPERRLEALVHKAGSKIPTRLTVSPVYKLY